MQVYSSVFLLLFCARRAASKSESGDWPICRSEKTAMFAAGRRNQNVTDLTEKRDVAGQAFHRLYIFASFQPRDDLKMSFFFLFLCQG